VTRQQAAERKGFPVAFDRESPIGLGFRVPLVIASPWTRGGYVDSEVFDLTSTIQFLETFLSLKTGKTIRTPNISEWRRTVCGNLVSAFRESERDPSPPLDYLKMQPFAETVYNAKFKKLPSDFHPLSAEEIDLFRTNPYSSPFMPAQEKGVKPSCALLYQLYVDGKWNPSKNSFDLRFAASDEIFGKASCGSPFNVYAPGKYLQMENGQSIFKVLRTWAFAVKPSGYLSASWPLQAFENNNYHLRVYGPNGFFREFKGAGNDPDLNIDCEYQRMAANKLKLTGNIEFIFSNPGNKPLEVVITDNAYRAAPVKKMLRSAEGKLVIPVDLSKQFGWYDLTVKITGYDLFEKRYAGRVETGQHGFSDPFMGRTI
jgi:phospholipase C